MGLRLFFLPNFPGAMFIQGATFIPDSRVHIIFSGYFVESLAEGEYSRVWNKRSPLNKRSPWKIWQKE